MSWDERTYTFTQNDPYQPPVYLGSPRTPEERAEDRLVQAASDRRDALNVARGIRDALQWLVVLAGAALVLGSAGVIAAFRS